MHKKSPTSCAPVRLAILISGNGSNMQAIVKHCQQRKKENPAFCVNPVVVVSDCINAPGLEKAKNLGIKTKYLSGAPFKTKIEGDAEKNYVKFLQKEKVDIIVLAGFMRVLKKFFLDSFSGKIVNIHPSLLPFFPGLDTHKKALEQNIKQIGASLHLVCPEIDGGSILMQRNLTTTGKNEAMLKNEIHAVEHEIFRQWVDMINNGIFL